MSDSRCYSFYFMAGEPIAEFVKGLIHAMDPAESARLAGPFESAAEILAADVARAIGAEVEACVWQMQCGYATAALELRVPTVARLAWAAACPPSQADAPVRRRRRRARKPVAVSEPVVDGDPDDDDPDSIWARALAHSWDEDPTWRLRGLGERFAQFVHALNHKVDPAEAMRRAPEIEAAIDRFTAAVAQAIGFDIERCTDQVRRGFATGAAEFGVPTLWQPRDGDERLEVQVGSAWFSLAMLGWRWC
jgi:hypothetical protein